MTDKLPTKSQIEKAAASDDEESLHSLLLQAFQYGTNYQQPEPPSKEQTGQASLLLVQVWTALPQIEATLVDVLWTLSSTITQEENLEALKVIISDLITQVPQRDTFYQQLQATLIDTELLQSLRLLDGDAFSKRIRKFNTEINFRQTKYNLMQEESQGYSKLLTLLYQNDMSASVTPERLNELMGAFELDPNRVLDLLLHVLEQRPDHQNFLLNLITQNFCVDKIPALLEFQLRSSTSIDSLYPTMILLAKRQLLDLKAVIDKSLQELHVCFGLFEKYLKLHIRQLGRISLAETGTQYSGDPKLDQAQKELHDATQKLRTQNILTGLLVALLQSGEWDLAKDLVSLLDWTKLCTLLPDLIGRHLTQQVSHSISRLYVAKVITPNVGISTPKSIENRANDDAATKKLLDSAAFDSLLEICRLPLMALGASGCLSRQPVLYVKICRLAKAFLLEESSADETSTAVYDLLRNVLIPSLSLIPEPNPALSADLWSLLSLVPYAKRYQIYSDWKGAGLERAAMMGVAAQKPLLQIQAEMEAGKAARYTLKRLSKDNVRDMGRQVSKVTHSNPLVVFTTILNQIESYDNLIQLMVEIVRFVTPLSLDVLSYCIQSRLSGQGAGGVNRNRLKGMRINLVHHTTCRPVKQSALDSRSNADISTFQQTMA
jgi:THO complex subunit 2